MSTQTIEASSITLNLDGLKAFKETLKKAQGMYARVGILGENAARKDGGFSNFDIGRVHEFGNSHVPERSFLRIPLQTHMQKAIGTGSASLAAPLEKGNVRGMFKRLGAIGETVVQNAFASSGDGKWPANAPATISKKGSESPLIDSGELRQAITSDVVMS
jgi:hypothetical protein